MPSVARHLERRNARPDHPWPGAHHRASQWLASAVIRLLSQGAARAQRERGSGSARRSPGSHSEPYGFSRAQPGRRSLKLFPGRARKEVAESIDKPGSVVDSHSSGRIVADTLKQPTRRHRGPRHRLPIWPCSRWGLPCRSVAGLAVRSYRTISPLPDPRRSRERRAIGGIFLLHFPSARAAQALPGTVPCGARTFLGMLAHDATA